VNLGFASPRGVAGALDAAGYLPDDGIASAAYLAMAMGRPLFVEGDPGVGKTALAHALADITGTPLVRLQCYEGIDASQALYDWDFPRQVLHLRAVGDRLDPSVAEASLYERRFLIARPVLRAIEESPCVLLVDEIDRADDEFEAFLLEVLADNAITIPELGTIRATSPPLVVLTSNRTREVHDALKRRCLYHWIEHPTFAREVEIVRRHLPDVAERLARDVAAVVSALREDHRDTVTSKAPSGETQRVRRRRVDPVRIVDDRKDRVFFRRDGEQRERRRAERQR